MSHLRAKTFESSDFISTNSTFHQSRAQTTGGKNFQPISGEIGSHVSETAVSGGESISYLLLLEFSPFFLLPASASLAAVSLLLLLLLDVPVLLLNALVLLYLHAILLNFICLQSFQK